MVDKIKHIFIVLVLPTNSVFKHTYISMASMIVESPGNCPACPFAKTVLCQMYIHYILLSTLSFISSININSRDQTGLVLAILYHELVSIVSYREKMRRHFCLPLSLVLGNNAVSVDRETSVGIDSNTEKSRVSLQIRKIMFYITTRKKKFKFAFSIVVYLTAT